MPPLNTITLLVNGLTLSLALGFSIIVLWNDYRKELNQFFFIFLVLVMLWNAGTFITLATITIRPVFAPADLLVSLMELGLTGSSIAIYALTTILVQVQRSRFRYLVFASLLLLLLYRVVLIASSAPVPIQIDEAGFITVEAQPLLILFYVIFGMATLYLVLRYRRKLRSRQLVVGIVLFVAGQTMWFLNPELQSFALALIVSSAATLLISFALLRQEIITPLAERVSQVEAMHKVSLAITSELAVDTVLREIATQAARWLNAEAAGIFLRHEAGLRLEAVHNLPDAFLGWRLPLGMGMAGQVAQSHETRHIENYARDWQGMPDLPYAKESFGSVICTPLVAAGEALGVLMVIAGRQGRLFQREEVRLLDFLGAQAAVAIQHGRLFAEQTALTQQFETLLTSTRNPVIAFDREFRLIFANPAADALVPAVRMVTGQRITDIVPAAALPKDGLRFWRQLRRERAYVYEITLERRVYLCQLAQLGRDRPLGWVAILNDVTQLKELDRMKSEMVRMTSHDLKNPLQGAMAQLELLSDGLITDEAERHTMLATVEMQLARMDRIIRSVLDLERIKSGMQTTEVCVPEHLVQHAVDDMRPFARERGVTLDAAIEANLPNFIGDYTQFQRALINLIENALKFTPAGGHVCVRVRRSGERLTFGVQDTGIGIAADMHDKIFDRFFRGKQKGFDHISGSGLGLSLVKAVVENHRGTIRVDSQVNVGTTFSIDIPATTSTAVVDVL